MNKMINHPVAGQPANTQQTKQAKADWWKGATIYHIYPRSFMDSNNDGTGDLRGIIEKIGYIQSLGVDAMWLSPIFTSPQHDFGYDVSDYRDIDPLFGSLEDFDELVRVAHAHGLKIIIDQVYSHTSIDHAWFTESRASHDNPKADWYVWADPKADGSPPTNWTSVFGGPSWQWDNRRRQYYLHNFLIEQPDLNLHNPEVQEEILNIARFWLERGVDGFRLDALNFAMHDPAFRDNPAETAFEKEPTRPFDFQKHDYNQSHADIPHFLEKIRQLFDEYPNRFTVAEVGGKKALEEMKEYTVGGKRLHSAYSFDYLYADSLTPAGIEKSLNNWPQDDQTGWPSWAYSNHDAPRAISRWAGDCDPSRYARLMLMTLISQRGNIFLYQGEELAMAQGHIPFDKLQDPEAIANWPETLGRDGARTPMPWQSDAVNAGFNKGAEPWLPIDPAHYKTAVDLCEADAASHLHFTRQMINLRQKSDCLRLGNLTFVTVKDSLLIFKRHYDKKELLCGFNLGPDPQQTGLSLVTTCPLLASVGLENHDDTIIPTTLPDTLPAYSGFIAQL